MTDAERIAAHEAGHAAAAVVLGVSVRLVDVAGDATALGRVRHGLEQVHNADDARKRMIIILCGWIESVEDWDELPTWPLQRHRSTDEANLAALADYLGLDERRFDDVRFEALGLTLDRRYQMLHLAITGMLGYVPRIGPDLLGQLIAITRES